MVISDGSCQAENAGGAVSHLGDEEDIINDDKLITRQADVVPIGERVSRSNGSPELIRRMSRTDTMRQDVRRLKSVTLDRMGKMFKPRQPSSASATGDKSGERGDVDTYGTQTSRKEKTNSLGRMLKLVDKDGSPKKLFAHSRAGSLSRIFRRHPSKEDEKTKASEENARGIISRMLSQLKSRPAGGSQTGEPNLPTVTRNLNSSLPPKARISSKMITELSTPAGSSTASATSSISRTTRRSPGIEYEG